MPRRRVMRRRACWTERMSLTAAELAALSARAYTHMDPWTEAPMG